LYQKTSTDYFAQNDIIIIIIIIIIIKIIYETD